MSRIRRPMGRALEAVRGRYQSDLMRRGILLLLVSLLLSPLAAAQHGMHNMPATGGLQVTSVPDNDEVLGLAPESIMLHFDADVQLVKLALKNPAQGKEPIDIGFRYRPDKGVHFVQQLPALPAADYYVVEWAVFDASHTLIKGVFYFSFGADAKPPSYYLNQMLHPEHIMSPDYRLL